MSTLRAVRPKSGEVLHFSEDPTIAEFSPHVAQTSTDPAPYVWAVDEVQAPAYWFPRQCPRATAWRTARTTADDQQRVLGPIAERVHVIEYGWLHRMQTAKVFAYRFHVADFEPYGDPAEPHAFVARRPVCPLGPAEAVGDLLSLHREAGIELRLTDSLLAWWDTVVGASIGFSGIRLANVQSPPDAT